MNCRVVVVQILDLQSDLQRAALLGALYHLASGLLTEKIGSTRWVSEFDLSSVSELLRTLDSDRVGQVEEVRRRKMIQRQEFSTEVGNREKATKDNSEALSS